MVSELVFEYNPRSWTNGARLTVHGSGYASFSDAGRATGGGAINGPQLTMTLQDGKVWCKSLMAVFDHG